jgi:hypothetical protein
VSAIALRRGAAVELEHTTSVRLAVEIAFGHLLERGDYYDRLSKVEGGEDVGTTAGAAS